MRKLIRNWDELDGLSNGKYMIILDEDKCCGWIIPVTETKETEDNYFEHHAYLSTHTFYGSNYKYSTELLRKFGFDVFIDNWDKPDQPKFRDRIFRLKKYIDEDDAFNDYDGNYKSDFGRFCIEHCEDIYYLIQRVEYLEKKVQRLEDGERE